MNTEKRSKGLPSVKTIDVIVFDRDRMSGQLLAASLSGHISFHPIPVTSSSEALDAINSTRNSVAVISADLDGGRSLGTQFARVAHNRHPTLRIVVLLDRPEKDAVVEAVRAGATGIFSRSEPLSEFARCVEHVAQGKLWAGKAESNLLLQAFKSIPVPRVGHGEPLTKRERQVVQEAAKGYTNKVIGEKLGLSEHTVKNYLFRSFEKLGVSSRVELLFFLTMEGQSPSPAMMIEGESSLEAHCKLADKGVAAALSALRSISENGLGSTSLPDIYFWLRLMEGYGEQVKTQSHSIAERLIDKIDEQVILELDSKARRWMHAPSSETSDSSQRIADGNLHNLAKSA